MDQMSQSLSHGLGPPPEGATLSSHRVKALVGLVVLIGAMGYLGFMALKSATVYFYTVDELQHRGPTQDGKVVRVGGKLVDGSFVREPDSTVARFTLTNGTETMAAVHDGVVPDLFFNEHSEIILEGVYTGETGEGLFESHNVIVKCPSKYIAAN
jgi:cytochrome c-type biogenesis protein CcmE